jgi:hypothetical protein
MINKNLHIREFETLMLKDYTATKITIYFATKVAEEGYDPYEDNLSTSNLNPKTIRGYIHPVTPQQLIYKQYGLSNIGAVEIICDEKFLDWFKTANKIVIDSIDYKTLAVGNAETKGSLVTKRAFKMGKIVLIRND